VIQLRIADCRLGIKRNEKEIVMNAEELKRRTKAFAAEMIRLTDQLPQGRSVDILSRQLIRSATSVGANYRAACRAKSRADFISKIGNVEEECDETIYWIELLVDAQKIEPSLVAKQVSEANELLAITVASINTARSRD
jgi:four helix bundle protein